MANIRSWLGIKTNIEMLYLPDEMFRQRGHDISLIFGKPVPWQTFDKSESPSFWAAMMKKRSYELAEVLKDYRK
jgi:hypothetical protein